MEWFLFLFATSGSCPTARREANFIKMKNTNTQYFVDKDQNHKQTALIFDKYCHFGSNFLLRCSLLSSCWDQIPTKRPTASEIAELLGGIENLSLITTLHLAPGSPRLVSPSIDVPLASVQVERTDSLEMIPRSEKTRNAMFCFYSKKTSLGILLEIITRHTAWSTPTC